MPGAPGLGVSHVLRVGSSPGDTIGFPDEAGDLYVRQPLVCKSKAHGKGAIIVIIIIQQVVVDRRCASILVTA